MALNSQQHSMLRTRMPRNPCASVSLRGSWLRHHAANVSCPIAAEPTRQQHRILSPAHRQHQQLSAPGSGGAPWRRVSIPISRSQAPPKAATQGFAAGSPSGSDSHQQQLPSSLNSPELQSLINAIPFRRLSIWLLVAAVAYQMSDFFGLFMGTFILSYIGNSFVDSALGNDGPFTFIPEKTRRRTLVLLYFGSILAGVTLLGVLTVPDIAAEGADFVRRLQSDNIWVVLVEKMRKGLGDQVMESLEKAIYLASSNDITLATSHAGEWTSERIAALGLTVSTMLKGTTTSAAKITAVLLKSVTKFAVQIIISLVLAFMMVWDLPSIKAGVASLSRSRLAPVYNEVAPVLTVFGHLFGKTLEVQARIAMVNTALTAGGMWLLGIPGMGLLSLIVFVCSFIPIAGCIISTVPIGFVALTEYGFFKLALVILMVVVVHFVEAYMLNPAIYSAHLKLHPLLVLSVLVIAEHAAGVWGLLLAVPITVFARDYCIRYPQATITDVGQRELQVVLASIDGDAAEIEDASHAKPPQGRPMPGSPSPP